MEQLRAKIERKRLENRRAALAKKNPPAPVSLSVRSKIETKRPAAPASISSAFSDKYDQDDESDDELDPKTQEALDKLVASVLASGISAEEEVRLKNQSNPAYWFLNDKSSSPYKIYKRRLEKSGVEDKAPSNTGRAKRAEIVPSASASLSKPTSMAAELPVPESYQKQDRKRKSRWGETSVEIPAAPPKGTVQKQLVPIAPPSLVSLPTGDLPMYTSVPPLPSLTAQGDSTGSFSRSTRPTTGDSQASGSDSATGDKNVKLETEMSETELATLRAQMQARAIALRALEKLQPPGSVDVEDEIVRGSWEHAKRKEEMEKTRLAAVEATSRRQTGGHHLSDFLPPEEMQKFLQKTQEIRQGIPADKSQYQDSKLTEGNKGFQLLQKMGWEQGSGLGSTGQGIVAPVNSGKSEGDHVGLGAGTSNDVSEDDDEFSVYRKRMMLAYKFRPNPLNNPRRQYY